MALQRWSLVTRLSNSPAVRDQLMASASDFNTKCGFMVRLEGGHFCCNVNGLPGWVNTLGAVCSFTVSAFQAYPQVNQVERDAAPGCAAPWY